MFDDDVLAEAGSRLCRVKEAFAAGGDDLEAGVLRFGDHKIFLKSVGSSMLCILAEGGINMPALRMAANLVGRRIAADVSRGESEPPPVQGAGVGAGARDGQDAAADAAAGAAGDAALPAAAPVE